MYSSSCFVGKSSNTKLECHRVALFGNCQLSTLLPNRNDSWIDSFYNPFLATLLKITFTKGAQNLVYFGWDWWNITKSLCHRTLDKRIGWVEKELPIHNFLKIKRAKKNRFFYSQLLNCWDSIRSIVEHKCTTLQNLSPLLSQGVASSKGERSETLRYIHTESCCASPIGLHMAGPICPKLSEVIEGRCEINLAKKFFWSVNI